MTNDQIFNVANLMKAINGEEAKYIIINNENIINILIEETYSIMKTKMKKENVLSSMCNEK